MEGRMSNDGLAETQAYANVVQREIVRADEHLVEAILLLAASVKELAQAIEGDRK
jgi:hypothetical protein